MKLYWNVDSPFSRSLKWLLLHEGVAHEDCVLRWDELSTSEELFKLNPKRQVPTVQVDGYGRADALLIALDYLPVKWNQSIDAKLFRMADSDMEAVVIFLFRARLLENKFGKSQESEFMLEAGRSSYKKAVDVVLDKFMVGESLGVGIGAVLFHSFLLVVASMDVSSKAYRMDELSILCDKVESDESFAKLASFIMANKTEIGVRWRMS